MVPGFIPSPVAQLLSVAGNLATLHCHGGKDEL